MSAQSAARKRRRQMKAAGVAVVHREQLSLAVGDVSGTIRSHLDLAIRELEKNGGDLTGRLRIDVGEHPEFPGQTTIEVKADRRVESHEGDCSDPRCPLDHSLDRLDG